MFPDQNKCTEVGGWRRRWIDAPKTKYSSVPIRNINNAHSEGTLLKILRIRRSWAIGYLKASSKSKRMYSTEFMIMLLPTLYLLLRKESFTLGDSGVNLSNIIWTLCSALGEYCTTVSGLLNLKTFILPNSVLGADCFPRHHLRRLGSSSNVPCVNSNLRVLAFFKFIYANHVSRIVSQNKTMPSAQIVFVAHRNQFNRVLQFVPITIRGNFRSHVATRKYSWTIA